MSDQKLVDLTPFFKVVSYNGGSTVGENAVTNIFKKDESEHYSKPGRNYDLVLEYTGQDGFSLKYVVVTASEGTSPLKTLLAWVSDSKDFYFSNKFNDVNGATWQALGATQRPTPTPDVVMTTDKRAPESVDGTTQPVHGKYLLVKFVDAHRGSNIDIRGLSFAGYQGKHANAVAPGQAAEKPKSESKPTFVDWGAVMGGAKKIDIPAADQDALSRLGLLSPTFNETGVNMLHADFIDQIVDSAHIMLIARTPIDEAEAAAQNGTATPTQLAIACAFNAMRSAAKRVGSSGVLNSPLSFFAVDPTLPLPLIKSALKFYHIDASLPGPLFGVDEEADPNVYPFIPTETNWQAVANYFDSSKAAAAHAQRLKLNGITTGEEKKTEEAKTATTITELPLPNDAPYVVIASTGTYRYPLSAQDPEKLATQGASLLATWKSSSKNKEGNEDIEGVQKKIATLSLNNDSSEINALKDKFTYLGVIVSHLAQQQDAAEQGGSEIPVHDPLVPDFRSVNPTIRSLPGYDRLKFVSSDELVAEIKSVTPTSPLIVTFAGDEYDNTHLRVILEASRLIHNGFRFVAINPHVNDLPMLGHFRYSDSWPLVIFAGVNPGEDNDEYLSYENYNEEGTIRFKPYSRHNHEHGDEDEDEDEDEDCEDSTKAAPTIESLYQFLLENIPTVFQADFHANKLSALIQKARDTDLALMLPYSSAAELSETIKMMERERVSFFGRRRFGVSTDVHEAITQIQALLTKMTTLTDKVPAPVGKFQVTTGTETGLTTLEPFADEAKVIMEAMTKHLSILASSVDAVAKLRTVARKYRGYRKYFSDVIEAYEKKGDLIAAGDEIVSMVGFEASSDEELKASLSDLEPVEDKDPSIAYIDVPKAAKLLPTITTALNAVAPQVATACTSTAKNLGMDKVVHTVTNMTQVQRILEGRVSLSPPKPIAKPGKKPIKPKDNLAANAGTRFVAIFITAPWDGSIEYWSTLKTLAEKYHVTNPEEDEYSAVVLRVDVDNLSKTSPMEVMSQFGVHTLPTVLFFKAGENYDDLAVVGNDVRKLEESFLMASQIEEMGEEDEDEDMAAFYDDDEDEE